MAAAARDEADALKVRLEAAEAKLAAKSAPKSAGKSTGSAS